MTALDRRSFIADATAFGAVGIGRAERPWHDFEAIQKEIEALPKDVFVDFTQGVNWSEDKSELPAAECEAMYARYPILRRYDDVFRKIMDEVRRTTVKGDKPAIWYVYNMGVIVKTRKSLFSIDLCHRLAPTIADELDFAIISHNHLDHYTRAFYRAMDDRHKTVIQNFECNYGAALYIVDGKLAGLQGGYSYGECKYDIGDVTVRTYVSDHNTILRKFVMPVEIHIGNYTILHNGDTFNVQDLRPTRTPDVWIHHAWCWGACFERSEWEQSETMRGIRAFHPRLAVVSHHQELSHKPEGRRNFKEALDRKTAAEESGTTAIVPFWGDRIV
ncbi:MAG: hypothetical protein K6G91_02910 [Kiritimatiellae bacterium]|nr:hypothetical protein [Kiritimatiellia bacterium]